MEAVLACLSDNVRERRLRTSEELMRKAEREVSCLRGKGVDVNVWGSASRQVATPSSDVDVWATNTPHNAAAAEECGFSLRETSACDAFTRYSHPSQRIDLTLRNECEIASHHWKKWDQNPTQADEEVKDILFCVNSHLKSGHGKAFSHGDALFSESKHEFGIKQKRHSFQPALS